MINQAGIPRWFMDYSAWDCLSSSLSSVPASSRFTHSVDHDAAGHHQHGRIAALGADFLPDDQHLARRDPLADGLEIILPQSLPGIVTGIILGLERAAAKPRRPLYGTAFSCQTAVHRWTRPWRCLIICSSSRRRYQHAAADQYGTVLVLLVFVRPWADCQLYPQLCPRAEAMVMADKVIIRDLRLRYSDGNESLKGVSLNIPENAITVLFGPAGGGKSSLLRVLNRLNDLADVEAVSGEVLLNGKKMTRPMSLNCGARWAWSSGRTAAASVYDNVAYAYPWRQRQRQTR